EGEEARALDRDRQLTLIARLRAGDARRNDLPVFLDEVLEDLDILVVDRLDAFGGKAAKLLALEQIVPALSFLAILFLGESSCGTGHFSFLPIRDRTSRTRLRASRRSRRCDSGARENPCSAARFPSALLPARLRAL